MRYFAASIVALLTMLSSASADEFIKITGIGVFPKSSVFFVVDSNRTDSTKWELVLGSGVAMMFFDFDCPEPFDLEKVNQVMESVTTMLNSESGDVSFVRKLNEAGYADCIWTRKKM